MKNRLLFMLIALLTMNTYAIPSISSTISKHKYHQHTKKTRSIEKSKKANKHKKHITRNYMNGIASYYGGTDGFDGKQMANGDIFDANNINMCAHHTLPLGTKLKVINVSNGRVIYVEVTDRMPHHHTRIIDLSKAAAKELGLYHKGLTQVQLVKISNQEFAQKKNTVEIDENDIYTQD